MTIDLTTSPRSLNFVKAIAFTLPWETGKERDGSLRKDGGLHYRDDGKPTKYGIWQGANPDLDVASLNLDQAIEIYKVRYWIPYQREKPTSLDMDVAEIGLTVSLFEAGVNCGVGRAWGWYMKAQKTKDPAKTINDLKGAYYFDLKSLDRSKYGPDFNGWMKRLADLKKYVDVVRAEQQ